MEVLSIKKDFSAWSLDNMDAIKWNIEGQRKFVAHLLEKNDEKWKKI